MLTRHNINKDKLSHLLAEDLFTNDLKQVFSAKSGKWIGTIREGPQITEQEEQEIKEVEKENINQLKLF
jgi:hypothetical protein